MPRPDDSARFSTMTGSSTDSGRSSITVKPLPKTPTSPSLPLQQPSPASNNASSRFAPYTTRRAPSRLKTDESANASRCVRRFPMTHTSHSRVICGLAGGTDGWLNARRCRDAPHFPRLLSPLAFSDVVLSQDGVMADAAALIAVL
jgi:hypothetical protein